MVPNSRTTLVHAQNPFESPDGRPTILAYGVCDRYWYLRWIRRLLLGLIVVAATAYFGWYYLLPTIRTPWNLLASSPRRRDLFAQCLNHTRPPGTMLFDEFVDVPTDVPARRTSVTGSTAVLSPGISYFPLRGSQISPWYLLCLADAEAQGSIVCRPGLHWGGYRFQNEVFAHGRRVGNGPEQFVLITFDAAGFVADKISPFTTQVVTWRGAMRPLRHYYAPTSLDFQFHCPADQPLKLYAGQPDAQDESHFTIEYETPAGKGTIDGWLQPEDRVKLKVRDGPAARHSL